MCVSSLEWTRDQVLSLEQAVDRRQGACPLCSLHAMPASCAWEHLRTVTYTDHTEGNLS